MSECHCIDPGLQLNCKQPNLAAHSLVLWANSFLRRCLLNLWTFHKMFFFLHPSIYMSVWKSSFLVSCNAHTLWTHLLFREFYLSFLASSYLWDWLLFCYYYECTHKYVCWLPLTSKEFNQNRGNFLEQSILKLSDPCNRSKQDEVEHILLGEDFAFLVSLEPVLNSELKWLKEMFNLYFVQKNNNQCVLGFKRGNDYLNCH